MCHRSRKVAHTTPHTHTAEDVVTRVQGGWQGCWVVEVGQIWQWAPSVQGPQEGWEAYVLTVVRKSAEKGKVSITSKIIRLWRLGHAWYFSLSDKSSGHRRARPHEGSASFTSLAYPLWSAISWPVKMDWGCHLSPLYRNIFQDQINNWYKSTLKIIKPYVTCETLLCIYTVLFGEFLNYLSWKKTKYLCINQICSEI